MEEGTTGRPRGTRTMLAVRQHLVDGHGSLVVEEIAVPTVRAGTALIRVHAAGITRDELDWAAGRLPAIPSYELSGIVESVAADVDGVAAGDPVIALTDFDRDGVAAEHAVVRADLLAPKPAAVGHRESAALPLAGLSAWQGLFSFGRLERGQRVLIHGGTGGVGHLAIQLARWRGAHVIATGSGAGIHRAAELGADETLDRSADEFTEIEPVDLVFDTVGGEVLARSGDVVRPGGAVVSLAEEPSADGDDLAASYFVVEPNHEQLARLAGLVDDGALVLAIEAVYPLAAALAAFDRVQAPGKHGKVVLSVIDD
jgi:NADPH:quinone reductase-like Zn-dependent oxidoreductase